MSDSLRPHRLQHARLPGVYSNSCPSSGWCHTTISSYVVPFSSCLQSCPASGSFLVSQFFTSHQVAQGLEFQLQHQSSSEYSGLISFRMGWFGLLAVQGTLKSLLQNHSSKASILQCSAFFIVQLSLPYMITGKTIALSVWTFVGKVMSHLFNSCLGHSFSSKEQPCLWFHGCSHHLQWSCRRIFRLSWCQSAWFWEGKIHGFIVSLYFLFRPFPLYLSLTRCYVSFHHALQN